MTAACPLVPGAIARLTANERECLRRRLLPQTAKEMARELGISQHAVEKRLKVARAKLGVSSSLAAARLLAAVEDQRMVSQMSDLSPTGARDHLTGDAAETVPRAPTRSTGGRLSMLVILLAAMLPQASSLPSGSAADPATTVAYRPATPDEERAFVYDRFRALDHNGSGYIERDEAPATGFVDPAQSLRSSELVVRGRTGQGMWIAMEDADEDGRVSQREFAAKRLPFYREHGVPVDWHAEGTSAAPN